MYRDIYEWLTNVKKVTSATIQTIRDHERKNNCSAYTAIEQLDICSLNELKAGVQEVYALKPLAKPIEKLKTYDGVPVELMRSSKFIAMTDPEQEGDVTALYILIPNPMNQIPAVDAVKRTGFKGKYGVRWITEEQFDYWLKLTSKAFGTSTFKKLTEGIESVSSMLDEDASIEDDVIGDERDTDQKIVELVNDIIRRAIDVGTSDIHIESIGGGCRIRFRIDGVLLLFNILDDRSLVRRLINRIKVVGRMDVNNARTPQSGKIKFTGHDIRVSTMPNVDGEKVVLRILNSNSGAVRTLPQLGFDELNEKKLRKMFLRPYGIILVSGPTGSGKSSTLAAILSELNTEDTCMITIEDPVEYRLPGATQVNVNAAAGLTFASVLRETLRQDPNIIMVGEIRDKETAEISMQASNTGHLVFSTIHTNSALSVITRLSDMGIDGYLVADNIIGIVSQSLIRKLCPRCKKPHIITEEDVEKYNAPKELVGVETYDVGDGCDMCNGTGYAGRTVAFEILEMTPRLTRALHERMNTSELEEIAIAQNFVKKLDYAYGLVKDGVTNLYEVSRVIGGINSEEANN